MPSGSSENKTGFFYLPVCDYKHWSIKHLIILFPMKTKTSILLLLSGLMTVSCSHTVKVRNGETLFEVNNKMHTRVSISFPGARPLMNGFYPSEYLVCKNFTARDFRSHHSKTIVVQGKLGKEQQTFITGVYKRDGYILEKQLEVSAFDSLPNLFIVRVRYRNTGDRRIHVVKWVNHAWPVEAAGDKPSFWSFQGSSTSERRDWILPVDSAFSQKNFMGMNSTDYGGGIPLVDLWRKDAGIAIGHAESKPWMVSLPVEKDVYDHYARIQVEYEYPEPVDLNPGDTLSTLTTFVVTHTGDCFSSLQAYSKYLQANGMHFAPVEEEAYEPVWCAWGYERKFTVNEILGTLPKVKELGIKWVDIDDGYQQAEGDWDVDRSKFPDGDAGMCRLVDKFHAMGLKVKIWWAPLAVDPGSKLLAANPDIILINKDGAPQYITWWNSYYMSPVYAKTIQHTQQVLKMFLQDWNYDGLKIDGQHLNCVPPDYNELHHLADPYEAYQNLSGFFQMIYQTARTYKPHSVIQICPCGCTMSVFTMPWMNQAVASDPESTWQTRLKGKVYKALLGNIAYYGDHVERLKAKDNIASEIGIGAVPGTKFTWPKDNPYATEGHFVLTPEKEKTLKHWLDIYRTHMLPKGTYLGTLYDIGYDKPETHVIQKGDTLYYAFYSPAWKGNIQLRGLKQGGVYRVYDYVNGKDLGTVNGRDHELSVSFSDYLLIEVFPASRR